jgi:hypothetical protein
VGTAGCRDTLVRRGRGLWRGGGSGRGFRYCLCCGVGWVQRVVGVHVARLGSARPFAPALALAAVVASSGRPDGAAAGALHGADCSKGEGRQPFVPVSVAQVLEQLGVVGAVPALSTRAAVAHRQGTRDRAGALAAALHIRILLLIYVY